MDIRTKSIDLSSKIYIYNETNGNVKNEIEEPTGIQKEIWRENIVEVKPWEKG